MKKLVKFFKEVKTELKKVNWPSKKQVLKLTLVVALITITASLYLGSLDFIFAKLLEVIFR